MERLMKSQTAGDSSSLDFMRSRRVFEINPEHPIIQALNTACKNSGDDEEALRAIDLLYETALISSGFTPESPSQLGGKIYEMMGVALSNKWTTQRQGFDMHSSPAEIVAEPQLTLEAEIVEAVETTSQK